MFEFPTETDLWVSSDCVLTHQAHYNLHGVSITTSNFIRTSLREHFSADKTL